MGYVELYSEALGEPVRVPEEPRRIVSLAPAITETLQLIGAWDRVVAVSYFCRVPRGDERPRVGGYLDARVEEILRMRPDLVLTTTGVQLELARSLRRLGLPVYPIPLPTSLYGVLDNVVTVGLVVGLVDEARRLARQLSSELNAIKPLSRRLRAYYEVCLGSPVTVGALTYVDHALSYIGLRNVFGDVRRTYFQPDPKEVARRDPELIIYEFRPGVEPRVEVVREIMVSRGLGGTTALRRGWLVALEGDTLAHPGPSLVRALRRLRDRVERVVGG